MAEQVEHWLNRRWGLRPPRRLPVRTATGWQVRGRQGGGDGHEVTHYFDQADQARAMLQRMLETVPAEPANWAQMTAWPPR